MFETLISIFITTASASPVIVKAVNPISIEQTQIPIKISFTPTPSPKPTAVTNQDKVIQLVNGERKKAGLSPVTKNAKLYSAAQLYAKNMATNNFFSHTGKDGSIFSQRISQAGYSSYSWIAENIAAGQSTPTTVMNTWMKSAGHRENILSPKAKEIGVGYYYNKSSLYKYYWVQEFGSK